MLGLQKTCPARELARRRSTAWEKAIFRQRYLTERTYQDAKTETGRGEFMARKYPAWEHHLALTAAALWLVAQTKLDWAQTHARDPELLAQLHVQVLPTLST